MSIKELGLGEDDHCGGIGIAGARQGVDRTPIRVVVSCQAQVPERGRRKALRRAAGAAEPEVIGRKAEDGEEDSD